MLQSDFTRKPYTSNSNELDANTEFIMKLLNENKTLQDEIDFLKNRIAELQNCCSMAGCKTFGN